jgi:hypothetical protein
MTAPSPKSLSRARIRALSIVSVKVMKYPAELYAKSVRPYRGIGELQLPLP